MNIEVDANTVGVALLVSNDYTTLKTAGSLSFTHRDADNLAQLFKEFTYAVYRRKNVSAEFVTCYKALAEFKYPPTCKRILVYFSGHGEDGALLMQDGEKVKIEDMISCFKIHVANNSTLAGVVKMFFIDACRGSQRDDGYYMKAIPDDEITCLERVPKEGNTLVAYASTRYHVSFGDATGSRWTNCLVKALRESKESDDVCTILTDTSIMMRKVPNQHYFQTAEFATISLVDHVRFKQEAIKKRNILVIGMSDSGKSSLINNVIGEDYLHITKPFTTSPVTPQHVYRELLINSNKYQCNFIELPVCVSQLCTYPFYIKDQIVKQITNLNQRECLERLNLIIHVIIFRRLTLKEEEFFRVYKKIFPKSISAIVITGCDVCNDATRTRIVEDFKSDEVSKDFAASMGKGIYTVGFPNLNNFDDIDDESFVEVIKLKMQEDVSQLHQVIEKSNDTVDVLKHGDTGCSII